MATRLRDTDRERLLAQEEGVVRKEHRGRLRVALCYPNTYHVGMSNLGLQTVYHLFNSLPDVVCERAFHPDEETRRGPIRALESNTALGEFDIVAFSLAYELDAANLVRMLTSSGIPARAAERSDRDPIVLVGGAFPTYNPEPIASIADACAIGEAEEMVPEIAAAMESGGRKQALDQLAHVEGLYLPDRCEIRCDASGNPVEIAGPSVTRRHTADLNAFPTHTRIFTRHSEFGHMFLLETARGCGRGCRFCAADHAFRPARRRSADVLLESARWGLQHRDTVGLVAPSVTDHKQIDEICERIAGLGGKIAIASVRADSVTETVLRVLAESGTRTITMAPEAGLQRLRDVIGKRIGEEDYFRAAGLARSLGIRRLKLYFMIGLPTETEEDVRTIADFVRRLRAQAKFEQITVACAAFVPKPRTPWEREAMQPVKETRRKLQLVRESLAGERWVRFAFESARSSFIQAALSRGDRRLGEVLVRVSETKGSASDWLAAFKSCGLDAEKFALRARDRTEPLPWALAH